MNSADMGSAAFASKLGSAFKESCGGPVLSWQTAKAHTIANGGCSVCHTGFSEATVLKVHKSTGNYTINGDNTMNKGGNYTFTVEIEEGYVADGLKVTANGATLTAVDGTYTVTEPKGHFYITVSGVSPMPDAFGIILPKDGNGYRVRAAEGYDTVVEMGKDFEFTVEIVDGFKKGEGFQVLVNNEKINPDGDGGYTISNVNEKKTIVVENVVTASTNSVTITVDITDGKTAFFKPEKADKIMIDQQITVPYFDLALYGMEQYYYNEYCYVAPDGYIDENGVSKDKNGNTYMQRAGTREDANGVVTVLHAFIYITDYLYLGLGEYSGTGYSDTVDRDDDGESDFDEAMTWGFQNVGSTFITNFWEHANGGNLNYHVNYAYPLAYKGWGSTSDQIALADGDVLSVHFIGDSANGSGFGFFAVNDTNNTYDGNETLGYAEVKAGESIMLTNYVGMQGNNYSTKYVNGANKDLYWVEADEVSARVDINDPEDERYGSWNREGFGNMTADEFRTDVNGSVTLDTTGMEPGTYYIALHGEFHKGDGTADAGGFVSNGAESGPSYFVLEIKEGDAAEVLLGDVNEDGEVDSLDATLAYAIYNEAMTDVTEAQQEAADVNKDGTVDSHDATLIYAFYNEAIDEFPVEAN